MHYVLSNILRQHVNAMYAEMKKTSQKLLRSSPIFISNMVLSPLQLEYTILRARAYVRSHLYIKCIF